MRELRSPQNIPDAESTKSRILMEAARMFAVYGYSTVSVRDIAKIIGIRPASIYGHFAGKQDILDSIMEMCETELKLFYSMVDRLSWESETFAQLLRNLFVEPQEMVSPFAYYSIYCASTNQFLFDSCRRLYYDIYFCQGHLVMRRQLEIAIQRGLIQPLDTREVASLITNCILNMVNIVIGYLNGFYQDFDISEWFDRTINHILKVAEAKSQPCVQYSHHL